MTLALEIAFAAGIVAVGVSVAAVAFTRVPPRVLLVVAAILGAATVGAVIVAGIEIGRGTTDEALLLVTAGGLLVATIAEVGAYALARTLERQRDLERVGEEGRARLESFLTAESERRKADLDRVLARERAHASHVLGEQERQLAEERRDAVARQAEHARVELTEAVASAQQRLESRLMAWAADLDRGQREIEAQLTQLAQRQKEALSEYDARLRSDTDRLSAASEEQRRALTQLRAEFGQIITQFVEEGRAELEAHAAERRRALHEVSERLRNRERTLREQIDREEAEARARLAVGLTDAERRQIAQLERALERAASRLAEEAERRFDTQIKESREKASARLSNELDRSIEHFAHQAEKDVSDRIAQLARTTAERMERRLRDVARAAEGQGEIAAERLRHVSERLDEALAAAEERIAAFEAEVDMRLDAKLGAAGRSVSAADRD
jgi:hypothetical protein